MSKHQEDYGFSIEAATGTSKHWRCMAIAHSQAGARKAFRNVHKEFTDNSDVSVTLIAWLKGGQEIARNTFLRIRKVPMYHGVTTPL